MRRKRASDLLDGDGQRKSASVEPFRHALERLQLTQPDGSSPHWLEAMINQIPDFIYAKDFGGRFLFANRAVVVENGLESVSDLIGRTDFDFHSFEAASAIQAVESRVMETGEPDLGIEEQALNGDGERWLMMSRLPLRDRHGKTIGVVGMSRDITARKKAEKLMQAQSRLLELVATGMPLRDFLEQLVLMIEAQHPGSRGSVMLRAADSAYLELAAAPSLPSAFRDLMRSLKIGPTSGISGVAAWRKERVIIEDVHAHPLAKNLRFLVEGLGLRSCSSTPILSYQGEVLGTFALFVDRPGSPDAQHDELTAIAVHLAGLAIERHRAEERIRYMARHDALTGLPNRLFMDAEFPAILAEARAAGRDLGVAFLDIDNFKVINDSLGHAAGDELLKIVASRVTDLVEGQGMAVRVGGDEFIVLLSGHGADSLVSRFEAIRNAVASPITLGGLTFQVTCSMGIACFPEHGENPTDLVANADAAMYRAKEIGRDSLEIFSVEMAEKARKKLVLIEEMRRALEDGQFVLHFQPQKNLSTGKVFGAEALVRWNHPTRGLVPPGDFIPLAEETGLIVPLGDWILWEACRQCKAWQDRGLEPLMVSVNVSARQFKEKAWAVRVATALKECGLDPRYLELEVTESLIMQDLAGAQQRMRELKALGVKLSIDDFGTGYSSLSALKSFPVSQLKIDRSFLADIPGDVDNMAITSAIVSLAQKLGLEVIAEGVETEEQARFLVESGCVNIQGYFVGRPVPPEDFLALLGYAGTARPHG